MEILTDCYTLKLKEIYLDNTTAENYTIEEYAFITENNYHIEDWVLLALDTGSLRDAQIHLQL